MLTKDALLISHKNDVSKIKGVVESLTASNRSEAKCHQSEYTPWGSYDLIDRGDTHEVKRITIYSGKTLTIQKHEHRYVHWIVVKGTATVIKGGKTLQVPENESIDIPKGTKHTLTNKENNQLEIIEIKTGAYLKEDDIIRY